MRQTIFSLFLVFTFSCQIQKTANRIPFPDPNYVTKTDEHSRVPGTKIYAIIPKSYKYIQKGSYRIGEKEFIKFMQPTLTFKEARKNISRGDFEKPPRFFEDFTYNDQPAFYAEAADKGQTMALLLMGADEEVVYVIVQFNAKETQRRKEVLNVLNSVVYRDKDTFDPMEVSTFTFNPEITKFKHARTFANSIRFTADGKYDKDNQSVNSMLFTDLTPMTKEGAKKHAAKRKDIYNDAVTTSEIQDTTIGEYHAFIFESEVIKNEDTYKVFHVILNQEKRSLMFVGTSYDSHEEMRTLFEETVQSIAFKQY